MGLPEIQHAIETLSTEQQTALLDWLAERDRHQWDAELERDFSPGGAGWIFSTESRHRSARVNPCRWVRASNIGELPVFRPA